ncbi:AAA family ATPase [Novosphingobium piscinae]|uniref:AAA family ATPase n=1 Tax=Novosphingobium piscinae TaxID=1507448 RepID=UPI0031B60946
MSAVAALHPAGDPLVNVEAEAAFLGAVLIDNSVLERFGQMLGPASFAEPVHGRIFERVGQLMGRGAKVTPITLRPYFEADESLRALGGVTYLARLTADGQSLLAADQLATDIADLAARRRRRELLAEQIAACADVGRPLDDLTALDELRPRVARLEGLDLAALANREPAPKSFIIPRLAPAGEVTLFTGAGAVGKSLLAQQLCTALAAGVSTLGLALDRHPAVYMTCEDDAEQLHFRQAHICDALGVEMRDLAGALHLRSMRGEDNALAAFDLAGRFTPAPLYHRLADWIRRTGARLVALDNVAHLFPENENDRREVTRFVNLLNRLAGETGAAILLLAHPNKAGDSFSGSTAWLNAVRSQFTLTRPTEEGADPDRRTLIVGKANYGEAGGAINFRWHQWAFVRDDDLPEDQRADLEETIRANFENAAFLRCLDLRNEQERPVSDSPASRTYAPKEFAAMPEAKGCTRARFEAAMERLYRLGEIETGLVCRTGRKDRFGLRRKCADLRADPAPTVCADPAPTPRRPAPSHTLCTTYMTGGAEDGPPPSQDEVEADQ